MALPGQSATEAPVDGATVDDSRRHSFEDERARDQLQASSTGFAQRAAQGAFLLLMAGIVAFVAWKLWPDDDTAPAPQASRTLNPGPSPDLRLPDLPVARDPEPTVAPAPPPVTGAIEPPADKRPVPPIAVRRAPPAGSRPAPSAAAAAPAPPPTPPPEPEPPLVRTAGLMSGPMQGVAGGVTDALGGGAEVVDSLFEGTDESGFGGAAGVERDPYAVTPRDASSATTLANPSLTVRKSTAIECALQTRIKTAIPGETMCRVTRDVYSMDLRTRLIEAGSIVHGDYSGLSGDRVGIVWTRLDTPNHKTVSLGSPAAGPLGAMGVEARINYQFVRRFGAAIMVSIVSDALDAASRNLSDQRDPNEVQFGANTVDATALIVQSMLQTYANVPVTGSVNQGGRVVVFLARDLDFSTVYDVRQR